MTVISPRRQLTNSCSGVAKILIPIAIPLIFLLIPAGLLLQLFNARSRSRKDASFIPGLAG